MGLQFNDTSTMQGLCQETDSICGTNSTNYIIADKVRRANVALDDFATIALASDDRWQFDDSNNTDMPIGTTDLVIGQTDYSFADDMLKILKVECKDQAGNWFELDTIDRNDVNVPLIETYKTNGIPQFYDKFASSLYLYPASSYESTLGLRVTYQRDMEKFVAADTTKQPGIPGIFHKYISLKMSEPFLRDNAKANYTAVRNEIVDYELNKIPDYYAKRDKDEKPQIIARVNNSF